MTGTPGAARQREVGNAVSQLDIAQIGLARHLSPTRSNGLAALLAFIRDTAREAA